MVELVLLGKGRSRRGGAAITWQWRCGVGIGLKLARGYIRCNVDIAEAEARCVSLRFDKAGLSPVQFKSDSCNWFWGNLASAKNYFWLSHY
ncbi:hypothetical protein CUMW_192610 [Citrus unshiu]|uniref:Uncharacterized protein n=1 Tax=Citrus unshiu TaxID=55188 RepID=A0A2H5Q3G2_CITUN|nr:hypothetical protein CUMW_192610 [Citrus unshiu]